MFNGEQDRVGEAFTWVFRAIFLVLAILSLLQKDYRWAFSGLACLFITFLPNIVARSFRISIPIWLEIWLLIALLLHLFGGLSDLYIDAVWYDHLTHVFSASFMAAIGYLIFRSIGAYSESIYFPEKFLSILVLFFVMASGMVWEIIEFAMDQFFDAGIQGSQEDTVLDIVFNLMGGGIVALIHFAHMVWGRNKYENPA